MRETSATGDLIQEGLAGIGDGILTLRACTPRYLLKSALEVMGQSAGFLRWMSSEPESAVVWTELQNKLEAFSLFEYVDLEIGAAANARLSLQEVVRRAFQLGPYRSVWAMEGIGHYYADSQRASQRFPDGLLHEKNTGELPVASLLPLHTGMGLSLAELALDSIGKQLEDCRGMVAKFSKLCHDNSREPYAGAAFEALGLVARNLYPHLVPAMDAALSKNEALQGYFWHGVGRGLYFAPANFLPLCSAPWNALEMCLRESPHALAQRNTIAGLSWALTLVNIRHPEIMAAFLKHHGEQVAQGDAFAHGVVSAMIIWREAAPTDHSPDAFQTYRPSPSHSALAELWERYVKQSCQDALHYHGILARQNAISEVFRYQDFSRIVPRPRGTLPPQCPQSPSRPPSPQ